jgi:hypothetical protein
MKRMIRMTQVGLVAMPDGYKPAEVTADDLASDPALCTAFAELTWHERDAAERDWTVAQWEVAEAVDFAWTRALNAATTNDEEGLRAALTSARDGARAAGFDTTHEDAALAMLPETARRAA